MALSPLWESRVQGHHQNTRGGSEPAMARNPCIPYPSHKYHMELRAIDYLPHPSTHHLVLQGQLRKISQLPYHCSLYHFFICSQLFPCLLSPQFHSLNISKEKRADMAFLHKHHVYGYGTLFAGLQRCLVSPGTHGL